MRGKRALELFIVEGVQRRFRSIGVFSTSRMSAPELLDEMARALACDGERGLTSGEPRRVYLVGFMGSGKTTVGRRLAEILDVPFVDLDAAYEAMAGGDDPIDLRDARRGVLSRREAELLKGTGAFPGAVVALGGGTFTFPEPGVREAPRRLGFPGRPVRGPGRPSRGKTTDGRSSGTSKRRGVCSSAAPFL